MASKRDVVTIWNDAVNKYNENAPAGMKIEEPEASQVTKIHDTLKVPQGPDKGPVFKRILKILGDISRVAEGVVETVGSLVSIAYPPAGAISQALAYVFKTCNKVSKNLEEIASFFETIKFFFERLSLLEDRMPPEHAFSEPLTRVLTSILHISGIARRYVGQNRVLSFAKGLVNKDEGLADAYVVLKDRMTELESSVLMATLGTATEININVQRMHEAANVQTDMLAQVSLQTDYVIQRLDAIFRKEGIEELVPALGSAETEDSAHCKLRATQLAIQKLKDRLFTSVEDQIELQIQERLKGFESAYLKGTCEWVLDNETWKSWYTSGKTNRQEASRHNSPSGQVNIDRDRALRLNGQSGQGKSMLAFYLFRYLKSRSELAVGRRILVAYFDFCNDDGSERSLKSMRCCCALQAAEQDPAYQKRLMGNEEAAKDPQESKESRKSNESMGKEDPKKPKESKATSGPGSDDDRTSWKSLFPQTQSKGQKGETILYLILDGENELGESACEKLEKELRDRRLESQYWVRVILTRNNDETSQCNVLDIGLGLETDLKLYAGAVLPQFPRLWRRQPSQLKIVDQICKEAQSYTHINYALYHLNQIRNRRSDEYKPVEAGNLFGSIFEDWGKWNTGPDTNSTRSDIPVRRLLTWLMFGQACITLRCADRLLKLENQDEASQLNIDEILDGPLGCIFSVSVSSKVIPASVGGITEKSTDEDDRGHLRLSTNKIKPYYLENYKSLYSRASADQLHPRVLMFEMLTNFLTQPDDQTYAWSELVSYAVSSWCSHLSDLTKDNNTLQEDANKKTVVDNIRMILNLNGKSSPGLRLLESRVDVDNTKKHISVFGDRELEDSTITFLSEYLGKDRETFANAAIEAKMPSSKADPKTVLLAYMAELHVYQWLSAEYPRDAYISFRLAHQALDDSKAFHKKIESRAINDGETNRCGLLKHTDWESFEQVLGHFGIIKAKRSAQQLKCLSMALRYDKHYPQALTEIKEAHKKAHKGMWREKFELLDREARIYFGQYEDAKTPGDKKSALENAVNTFDEALKTFPSTDAKIRDPDRWGRLMIYQLKALAEAVLHKRDECKASVKEIYNNSTPETPETRKIILYFDDIVSEMANGSRSEKNQSKKERSKDVVDLLHWVHKDQLSTLCAEKTHRHLQRAVRLQNEPAMLDKLYDEAVLSSKNRGDLLAVSQLWAWRGTFERLKSKDETAKEYLQNALDLAIYGDLVARRQASWQLADILLDDFLRPEPLAEDATPVLACQETARDRLEQLLKSVLLLQEPSFQPELSPTSLPLTIMYRHLGPIRTFKERADATFRACLAALEDDTQSNDAPSLRMLAKTLLLIPGLEWHAGLAFYYQFYTVTKQASGRELNRQAKNSIKAFDMVQGSRKRSRRQKGGATGNNHEQDQKVELEVECSNCAANIDKRTLKNASVHLRCACTHTLLCNTCYKKRDEKESLEVRCASQHQYIKAPPLTEKTQKEKTQKEKTQKEKMQGEKRRREVVPSPDNNDEEIQDKCRTWLKDLQNTWANQWKEYLSPTVSV